MRFFEASQQARCVLKLLTSDPAHLGAILPSNLVFEDVTATAVCHYLLNFPFDVAIHEGRLRYRLPRPSFEPIWRLFERSKLRDVLRSVDSCR